MVTYSFSSLNTPIRVNIKCKHPNIKRGTLNKHHVDGNSIIFVPYACVIIIANIQPNIRNIPTILVDGTIRAGINHRHKYMK